MANGDYVNAQTLLEKRDKKVKPHLEQYAPVWIVDEQMLLEEDAIQFNAVFMHPHAGLDNKASWISRRYRYDGFNDTLYHKGQTILDEEDIIEITEKEPYINATVTDIPNSYGG